MRKITFITTHAPQSGYHHYLKGKELYIMEGDKIVIILNEQEIKEMMRVLRKCKTNEG